MKRFILVLAVAALMAAMVVVMAAPAFAVASGLPSGSAQRDCGEIHQNNAQAHGAVDNNCLVTAPTPG